MNSILTSLFYLCYSDISGPTRRTERTVTAKYSVLTRWISVTKVLMMRRLLMSNFFTSLFCKCRQAWICGVTTNKNRGFYGRPLLRTDGGFLWTADRRRSNECRCFLHGYPSRENGWKLFLNGYPSRLYGWPKPFERVRNDWWTDSVLNGNSFVNVFAWEVTNFEFLPSSGKRHFEDISADL